METGMTQSATLLVKDADTALKIGSGDLEVLATPALIALMEHAAMQAVAPALPEGYTTVGAAIDCKHNRPTGVGQQVKATATLEAIENERKLTFHIVAEDEQGPIGEATHVRFIVNRQRFIAKLPHQK